MYKSLPLRQSFSHGVYLSYPYHSHYAHVLLSRHSKRFPWPCQQDVRPQQLATCRRAADSRIFGFESMRLMSGSNPALLLIQLLLGRHMRIRCFTSMNQLGLEAAQKTRRSSLQAANHRCSCLSLSPARSRGSDSATRLCRRGSS
jgi:hypothetical protein